MLDTFVVALLNVMIQDTLLKKSTIDRHAKFNDDMRYVTYKNHITYPAHCLFHRSIHFISYTCWKKRVKQRDGDRKHYSQLDHLLQINLLIIFSINRLIV